MANYSENLGPNQESYLESSYSAIGDGWYGYRAFDGNSGHSGTVAWKPTGNTNEWVYVQFTSPQIINKLVLHHGSSGDSQQPCKNCILYGSDNGSDWTKIPATSAPDAYASIVNTDEFQFTQQYLQPSTILFETNLTAYEYVKFHCTDNWGGATLHVREIELYQDLALLVSRRSGRHGFTSRSSWSHRNR